MQLIDLHQDSELECDYQPDAFRLLAGEGDLSDYQFNTKSGHHMFCRHCAVRTFERGYLEQIGGDHVSIRLAALDNVDAKELEWPEVDVSDSITVSLPGLTTATD